MGAALQRFVVRLETYPDKHVLAAVTVGTGDQPVQKLTLICDSIWREFGTGRRRHFPQYRALTSQHQLETAPC